MFDLWFHGPKWNFSSKSSPKEAIMISLSDAWLCKNLLKPIWVSVQMYKVVLLTLSVLSLFLTFHSILWWNNSPKSALQSWYRNSGTLDVLNALKSKNIIKKIGELKSYKIWASGICNPKDLIYVQKIYIFVKKNFLHFWVWKK